MKAVIKKYGKNVLINLPGVITAVALAIITSKFIEIELWMLLVSFILLYILVIMIVWLGKKYFGQTLVVNPEEKGIIPNNDMAIKACGSRNPHFITDVKEFETPKPKVVVKPKKEKPEKEFVLPECDEEGLENSFEFEESNDI